MKPLVGADNEWTIKDRIPQYLLCPEILSAEGIVPSSRQVSVLVAGNDRSETVDVKPVGMLTYGYWFFRPLAPWKHKPVVDPSDSDQILTIGVQGGHLNMEITNFLRSVLHPTSSDTFRTAREFRRSVLLPDTGMKRTD